MSESDKTNLALLRGGAEQDESLLPGWPCDAELDPYGSRMLADFGLPLRLASRLIFDRIDDSSDLEPVRSAARDGSLVYVMRTRSLLDFFFFNHFLRKHDLPLARFANGVRTTLFAPLLPTLRSIRARFRYRKQTGQGLPDPVDSGYLERLVGRGDPVLVFLRRGRKLFSRAPSKRDLVEVLVEAQRGRKEPIFLVPQILVWERRPDRTNRGLFDVLLGGQDSPGFFRKALHFLLYHRRAVVRVGEPLNLKEFIEQQEGQSNARVAKKLRWLLLGYLFRERKVVKGPDVRPRRWIFDRILSEPKVRTAIQRQADREGRNLETVEKRARKVLNKAAADFRWGAVMFFRSVLDVVVRRIYSGVEFDPEDAERIRKAARKGTVVLIPSHRSHFDYLLLSWLLFHQGMMPPHIAAGSNLSFFPVGTLFRRCGAFFIRRSFAEDRLYTTLMTHYIRALTAEGYTQEFFIEGGRSRTGKMLRPKIGLLWTYVDAMVDRIVQDIQIVPIYIAYERIVEDYAEELSGGEKKKESAGELVRGAGVLRKRFGRVYVKVNEPVSIRESLGLLAKPWREMEEAEQKGYLNRFAKHITAEIQDVTVVTPSTVAATVLLTHDHRGMTRSDFHARGRFFCRWLEDRDALFSDAWQFPDDALDETLELFASQKFVELLPETEGQARSAEDIVTVPEEAAGRMRMDYYKNNILFHFVPAALLCTALLLGDREEGPLDLVRRRVRFLLDLFNEEFFFHPDLPIEVLLGDAGRGLQKHGVLQVISGRVEAAGHSMSPVGPWLDEIIEDEPDALLRLVDRNRALLFVATIRNFFEAYWVVLKGSRVLRRGPLSEKDLVESLLTEGRRMYFTEDITMAEAISKVNLANAVRQFQRKGVLVAVEGSRSRDSRLVLDEEVRERYLGPMQKLFHSGRLLPPMADS